MDACVRVCAPKEFRHRKLRNRDSAVTYRIYNANNTPSRTIPPSRNEDVNFLVNRYDLARKRAIRERTRAFCPTAGATSLGIFRLTRLKYATSTTFGRTDISRLRSLDGSGQSADCEADEHVESASRESLLRRETTSIISEPCVPREFESLECRGARG